MAARAAGKGVPPCLSILSVGACWRDVVWWLWLSLLLSLRRFSLCNPGWLPTHHIAQTDLQLTHNPPALASHVLDRQLCLTSPGEKRVLTPTIPPGSGIQCRPLWTGSGRAERTLLYPATVTKHTPSPRPLASTQSLR